ncbi:site-specific DNA-methyltransferase [Corynebacterium diphtheriae]|uniref:site-specific DNA-methyltransferase n=1 Tax=Corynebacterium diphtheriae TaxID=1717 RepID=UPI00092ADAD8|nr:site-specific DNA-methyltransferase [Corynebacterium diphtheriae]MBG9304091.1 site-specific DNA-methyltransferase [Corynebacterium diphtheriae bv. mitis]MBG9306233.1 site-specific DNA-methyltransferase [Corynebacterium diphtheriae bv. mitis]OJH92417.1 site-specific DNA-methyltransferase [Corynebacterium diphtheriae]CAB0565671.1 site-specific DNA-methyltransferase [Corynebacterium diphtheriae]CAB0758288.1 site-specific DNA-methyltransferase [Corynebacterium diphtheriae]
MTQRLQLTWYNKDKALIPTETGKYGYTWVDPSDPRYCETHTLIFDDYVRGAQTPKSDEFEYSERADLQPQDDNLLILGESGDVLEALTRVPELAEKYIGKVKLIYIDPPFNTAKTFASYEDNLEHSIWLTMMRDRLIHMKKLLADDGSIWVHLDYAENHRMRLLLDEIFGDETFVAEVVWQKADSPRSDGDGLSVDQDVLLVYKRSSSFSANRLPRLASRDALYGAPDGDPRVWISGDPAAPGADRGAFQHPGVYGIQNPVTGELIYPARGRVWSNAQKSVLEFLSETAAYKAVSPNLVDRQRATGIPMSRLREDVLDLVLDEPLRKSSDIYADQPLPRLYFTRGGSGNLKMKKYLDEIAADRAAQTWWTKEEVGHNRGAKKEITSLFPGVNAFSTPKPERLLARIIHIGSNPGDIVLDVFGGSGTTAAVAQKMGRRWVTCELLESTFTTFTRPRLEKVVNDEDPGGITRTKGERVDATVDGLPDGVSPEDAAKFTSVLNKLIKGDPELKKSVEVKTLKAASKTKRTKEVVNWRGGGGFQVAHLSPACFDYDPALDRVMLTAAATGETLIESVAANLGFTLLHPDDDYVFDARRGNALLKVVEGVATPQIVDWLASQIQPGETIVLAATTVMDGVRQHLRKAVKGSRVVALPDDLFRYSQGGEK